MRVFLIYFLTSILAFTPAYGVMIKPGGSAAASFEKLTVTGDQVSKLADKSYLIETGNKNLLVNPSFEAALPTSTTVSGWTLTSNVTPTLTTSNVYDGLKALRLKVKQDITVKDFFYQSISSTQNYTGKSMEFSIRFTPGAVVSAPNARVYFCVLVNGTFDLGGCSKTVTFASLSQTSSTQFVVPFLGANAGSYYVTGYVETDTSSGTTEWNFDLDDAYVGPARNIGSISQAYKVGSIFVSGCSWSTSSTSYVNYAATTGCTYSVTGSVLAPSTMIPGFRLPSIKSGSYQFVAVGNFLKSTTTGGSALFRFSDGVRVSRPNQIGLSTASDLAVPTIGATFDYASSQGETTFQIQGTVNNASVGANVNGFEVAVYFFPSSNDLIVSTQNQDSTDRIFFTPTATGLGSGSGSFSGTGWNYYTTNGMNATICYRFVKDSTAGSGASTVSFSLPPGITVASDATASFSANSGFTGAPLSLYLDGGVIKLLKSSGSLVTGSDLVANNQVNGCITIPTTSKKPTNGAVIINAVNDMSPVDAFLSSQATTAGTLQKLNIVATVNPSGLFSGGTFTAKEKCNYLVNSGADIGPFSTGPGAFVQTVLAIYKNGAEFRRRNGTSSSVPSPISLSAIVPLNSGETLELYGNPGTGNGNGMGNISMQVIKLPNCN